jgi:hypothetical protein
MNFPGQKKQHEPTSSSPDHMSYKGSSRAWAMVIGSSSSSGEHSRVTALSYPLWSLVAPSGDSSRGGVGDAARCGAGSRGSGEGVVVVGGGSAGGGAGAAFKGAG